MTVSNRELSLASQGNQAEEASTETVGEVTEILRRGPRGAMLIAGVAVGMLFLGWLLFYFVLFMSRGYVG